ncbi:TadE/TadG family type IV pilus assembly protein [Altericroceibacterium xinjiangense]|uniref:TadE/TadG family type IV pilus assembly protein n=1 Tax=Altericroceibacterium xinjiangense TaxID=762261 RepID=UPI0013E082C1|nr:TadE/TadG family type IV pilus assembly protein [Altericroceibacterium xinjiangense]
MIRRVLRSLVRCQAGSAAIEAAFALPVLFITVFGTIEFGRLALVQSSINYAVAETARCAVIRPDVCGTSDQAAAYAADRIRVAQVPAAAFTLTSEVCGKKVSAQVQHQLILYRLFDDPTLTAEFCRE